MNESTYAFINGLRQPGDGENLSVGDYTPGEIPPLVSTTAGDTVLGDVTVNLTQAEKGLVGKWPTFFTRLRDILDRYKLVVWPLVFIALWFAFSKRRK